MVIRNRNWRRFQKYRKDNKNQSLNQNNYKHEKKWKLLYTRSVKLHRAKQLCIEYPRKTLHQVLDENE